MAFAGWLMKDLEPFFNWSLCQEAVGSQVIRVDSIALCVKCLILELDFYDLVVYDPNDGPTSAL